MRTSALSASAIEAPFPNACAGIVHEPGPTNSFKPEFGSVFEFALSALSTTWIEPSGPVAAVGWWMFAQPETMLCALPTAPAGEIGVSRIDVYGARPGPAQSTWSVPSFARASPTLGFAPLIWRVIWVHVPGGPAVAAPASRPTDDATVASATVVRMTPPLLRALDRQPV